MRSKTFTNDIAKRQFKLALHPVVTAYIKIIRKWYFLKFGVAITKKHAVALAIASIDVVYPMRLTRISQRLRLMSEDPIYITLDNTSLFLYNKLKYIADLLPFSNRQLVATAFVVLFALHVKREISKLKIKTLRIYTDGVKDKLVKRYSDILHNRVKN